MVVGLAVVPAVRADDHGAGGPEAGQPAAAANASGDGLEGQGNGAEAPGPTGGEAPGNSENAPGHADGSPGSSENAPGHGGGSPGNSENAPGHAGDESPGSPDAGVEQGAAIGQSATASASAAQDTVGNTHVTVRVDEPGNGQPIGQENRAEAEAGALASAAVDGGEERSIDQAAQADAEASQVDAANTVVTVRVGSPGDDAPVLQANVASAAATSAADGGGPGSESAQATATQVGASNTSISVRVFSPGDDGAVGQTNETAAAAHTGDGTGEGASASQQGARNTSVSIRVGSTGTNADVSQANTTAAGVTPSGGGIAVATTHDAVNTVVAVAVDGAGLDRPGATGLQIWVWEWAWERNEAESVGSLLAGDISSWTWAWDGKGPRHGTVTQRTAGDDDRDRRGGSWEWRWEWDRGGVAGWTWRWDWHESLACDSCVWIWNWSWSWTGTPADVGSETTPGAVGAPTQLNAARASAEAAVAVDVAQAASQEGSGHGGQYAGQLARVGQGAEALADAEQVDVASLTRGNGPLGTSNLVESDASVVLDATLTQAVEQLLEAGAGAGADQWSGQEVELGQLGAAEAVAIQHDATLTAAGTHAAHGVASAAGTVAVDQVVEQDATVAGGRVAQWAGQLTLVEQAVDAGATVDQAGTTRSRVAGGAASASSTAGGLLLVDQSAQQASLRTGGAGYQTASQLVYAAQDAAARAATTQLAGAAVLPFASSDAGALNRAAVVQEAAQRAVGWGALDVQELLQQSIVVQGAFAVSTSNGGIAGSARVVNCAVTQQGAAQSLAAGAPVTAAADLTAFCLPVPQSPGIASPTGDAPGAPAPLAVAPVLRSTTAPTAIDDASIVLHGARATAGSPARAAALRAPDRAAPTAQKPTPLRPEAGSPHITKSSTPHSTQARLDTRPGSSAGTGDAGREPPLPPAGDPPTWISALAAAASGAGASGIAAILLAFALVPPMLLRVLEGSVVRRPTGVLARVEVPI